MIIVSQDKMEIFNFEEIFRLYVDNWSNEEFATEPNCFCIKAEKSSDNMICAYLGEYDTEERAKEILSEIVTYNANFNLFKCSCAGTQARAAKEFLEKGIMFDIYVE